MADRYPQERYRKQTVVLADQVPTPGLVGPWSPAPANVDAALEQLIARPHEVVLAQVGPDITGFGFGVATWPPGNWIGTNTTSSFTGVGSPDFVGGYIAQTNEILTQLSVTASDGPAAASTIWVWVKPSGGVFADIAHAIPIALGAKATFHTTPVVLNQGDAIAFLLDAGDPAWVVGAAITIKGRRIES